MLAEPSIHDSRPGRTLGEAHRAYVWSHEASRSLFLSNSTGSRGSPSQRRNAAAKALAARAAVSKSPFGRPAASAPANASPEPIVDETVIEKPGTRSIRCLGSPAITAHPLGPVFMTAAW